MRLIYALILLGSLMFICASLFLSVIWIKFRQGKEERKRIHKIKFFKPVLRKLVSAETPELFYKYKQALLALAERLKEKPPYPVLEEMILDILEDAEGDEKARACALAGEFGFPGMTIAEIKSRRTGNAAIGCRKAGLYGYKGAVPDILNALEIMSSETQYQALMALSRIGDAAVMVQAFDKIQSYIFVNERTVIEILDNFAGNRRELFKKMLYHNSLYLVRLFLKAIDGETANILIEDIVRVIRGGSKETRLAGLIAVGKSGNRTKIYLLLNAMDDDEWEIRAMAAKTLGTLKGPGAVKSLKKGACDNEWWVRQNAITSILAYPNCGQILKSIARTGDKYAYHSILYTLGKVNENDLLLEIKEVWTEKSVNNVNSAA